MTSAEVSLSPNLLARVLAKLGLDAVPENDLEGLTKIYSAWCRNVPFDNSLKMLAVKLKAGGPLPGSTPLEFFENWLRFGSGGTCWSGNGALCALLRALGFSAELGVATMLVVPDLPPNHGTVVVDIDGAKYWVDASILHSTPLLLDESIMPYSSAENEAWGVHVFHEDDRFQIRWNPLHISTWLVCRLEHIGATHSEFQERYDSTREWSPFNYELNVRLIKNDLVVGIAHNSRTQINQQRQYQLSILTAEERAKTLTTELGFQEELATRIPQDSPTPPPPWSKTATRQRSAEQS